MFIRRGQSALRRQKSEIICFLDADDRLSDRYVEEGAQLFHEPNVAVVYSDVEYFGRRTGRSNYPEAFDRGALQRDNFIHAGSLVRRSAIESAQPFSEAVDPITTPGDWLLWRRVLTGNWIARKQAATYFYRQHSTNWSTRMRQSAREERYFHYANLKSEVLTLFIPLSGRASELRHTLNYLNRQAWPREQLRLILLDTSQNLAFSSHIRNWIGTSPYSDIRYVSKRVGDVALADADRRDSSVRSRVVSAMWRIYNFMLECATTEYIWVLEDDIFPPADVARRLMGDFDAMTASVAAPYRSRFQDRFVAWSVHGEHYSRAGEGTTVVGGNGFGCTILRRSCLQSYAYGSFDGAVDFDVAFYKWIGRTRFVAKLNWACTAHHGVAGFDQF